MDNRNIIEAFSKYCRECKGRCCSGIMVGIFDWELPRTAGHTLPCAPKDGVLNIAFENDCLFLKDHRCSLPSEDRLLDCLSYPVYPRISGGNVLTVQSDSEDRNVLTVQSDSEDRKLAGLMVHKNCPYHEAIAKDANLLGMVKLMWEENLKRITPEQAREFFAGEFWDEDKVEHLTV